ncbi:MAG TPA: M3 family metallopeptidase [Verrucomicrobiae bacterium]|nr:M3 family metallopeptidase [Verrucomicrobiae bacterium]
MTKNSFLHPIHELHFGTYAPEDVEPALDATEKLAWERLKALEELPASERTFENTILALTRSTDEFDAIVNIVGTLESGLGETWNDPYELAVKRSSQLHNAINMHEGLFRAVEAYAEAGIENLPANKQKLVTEIVRDFKHSGVSLPKAQRDELSALRLRLSELTTKFAQNAVKASDAAGLLVSTEAELAGLDAEFIAAAKDAATKKATSGYWISYNEPNYVKVMSQCSVSATRQAFHKVANTRAADTNPPVAEEILALRQKIAAMLGYKNYADYVLAERMAKNGDAAKSFIADLTKRYKPKSLEEHQSLVAFAREYEKNPKLELSIADIDSGLHFYYAAKQAETISGVDEEAVRAYFPLDSVLEGMFTTLTTLYGVTFAQNNEKGWHEDVVSYDLHDEQGRHIARVWCDWFARPGKKGGAWMDGHYTDPRPSGAVDKPHLGHVCANLERPAKNRPSLLTLRDVETVWHEFGHFMHFALSSTELPEQSMNACLWDFIEAPSQIMENWVWQPEVMKSMAKHYQTGEILSDDTIVALVAGRTFRVASAAMRQLYFATVDLALHTEFSSGEQSLLVFSRDVKQNFVPLPIAPYEASIATFSHIFAGGYAAAYYSYKWAEVIEADLFSRFKKEGVRNPETGRAYAKYVLSRGDEVAPDKLIEDFLGRPASSDAMLQRDGVAID